MSQNFLAGVGRCQAVWQKHMETHTQTQVTRSLGRCRQVSQQVLAGVSTKYGDIMLRHSKQGTVEPPQSPSKWRGICGRTSPAQGPRTQSLPHPHGPSAPDPPPTPPGREISELQLRRGRTEGRLATLSRVPCHPPAAVCPVPQPETTPACHPVAASATPKITESTGPAVPATRQQPSAKRKPLPRRCANGNSRQQNHTAHNRHRSARAAVGGGSQ